MRRRLAWLFGLCALATGLIWLGVGMAGDKNALWKIVDGQCIPHWTSAQDASPCAFVDLSGGRQRGVAILKDRVGIAQLLAIPTTRISGIESVELQGPEAPDLFGAAWQARRFVWQKLGKSLPRDGIGLAINSAFRRSQDQAHIHIDCSRPDVRALLLERTADAATGWSAQPFVIDGVPYDLLRVGGHDLASVNPFDLAAQHLKSLGVEMSRATIVVVGTGSDEDHPGFVILVGLLDPQHPVYGHGEDLLEHTCRLAT